MSLSRRILVTGANGLVGSAVVAMLLRKGCAVRAVVRSPCKINGDPEVVPIGDIDGNTDWSVALREVDVVIHLAARAHILRESERDPEEAFHKVNVAGTKRLADSAILAGVKRLIHLSSIGVHGAKTDDKAFSENSPIRPHDAYSRSKWDSEKILWDTLSGTSLQGVVLRSPLVYGPGPIKGNMLKLLSAIYNGYPLPFLGDCSKRDLIGTNNLADAIRICIESENAAGETFVVCDRCSISTPGLIQKIAVAMKKQPRFIPVPNWAVTLISITSPRIGRALSRLSDSLRIDASKIATHLSWKPPQSLDQGIKEMVADYLSKAKAH